MTTLPLLEAERLTVRRAGRAVLDDVSMAVAGGDMVALYGPSGSGKSTLLAVLAGLEPPGEGEVRSEGRDLHGLPAEQRRALRRGRIALVLQAYGLLALLTARENVELAQRLSGRDLAQATRPRAAGLRSSAWRAERSCDRMLRLTDGRVPAPADPPREER
jgi:predicted ABC-type transport system involved in lysophospholipase L1 biosynthesis ATPase subunit